MYSEDVIARFESRFEKTDGCWLWAAGKGNGYGRFKVSRFSMMYAHRLSWEIYRGAIPEGLLILHHCDVRNCVNPDHLYPGTNFDNMRDMVKRERCHHSKLTTEEVALILELYSLGNTTIIEISELCNISYGIVQRIIIGHSYKHIPREQDHV